MMGSDRWQRPSRSSRLRGDDLDRRIVNIDPERILREQRAQRRLQNQLQVPDDLHACLERSVGTLACGQLPMPNRCSLTDLWMQHISALIGSDPMQAEDKPGVVHCLQARKGREAAAQQPNGLGTERDTAADGTLAGVDAAAYGADGGADLADLTSPGALAATPAPLLATPHHVLADFSTGDMLYCQPMFFVCSTRTALHRLRSTAHKTLIWPATDLQDVMKAQNRHGPRALWQLFLVWGRSALHSVKVLT